jgi:AcrR family transcriptional regulator
MLRESGMHGAGIKEIVARSETPIGSLYHYFPNGKPQLVAEALRRHGGRVPPLLTRFFDQTTSPPAAVRRFFDFAAEAFERSGADKGCAIGAVALDLGREDGDFALICNEVFESWIEALLPRLPFRDARTRRSFASAVVVAIEGAFVVSKAARNGDAFRQAGRWLAEALERR